VHDYGDLCQSITELAEEQRAAITVAEFGELNIRLDNAIAGAVTEFARQREILKTDEDALATNERLGVLAHEMRNLLNTTILNQNVNPQTGFAAGGVVGYDFVGPRVELEGVYRYNQHSTGFPGQAISNRLVSISDPDARPIRKGKLNKPTEFGYVMQLTELCENTRRGARGLILPAASQIGSPNEQHLLPGTGTRLRELGLRPRELALDAGFTAGAVGEHLPEVDRLFIAGRHAPHSRKTNRRLAKFRVGAEGRISHLKRRYGLDRSRLKGHTGARTWAAWAILAYNLDTLAIRAA